MIKIFRRPEPDTRPVAVGRVPRGGIVTEVPDFDSISPIGLERSVPDKEAFRQKVRQLVAEQAERGTLSGSTGAMLDHLIEYWRLQWDIGAHDAYLGDQAYVNQLIASQAHEHADRIAAQVAALRQRRADAAHARAVACFELTGDQPQPDSLSADEPQLPRLLTHQTEATVLAGGPDSVPAHPGLRAIEGVGE